MKFIKGMILVLFLSTFTLNTAYAACDCSDPKGFHCKMTCKLKGEGSSSETKTTSDDSDGSGIGGIWKKIKNFGGKNIGSEG
tara:strand:+ start:517 stop:762 length:246 start_codon:yes stop_codon:yes gene_type:complete